MTSWRSSRFLLVTRSWSPWICACTPLGPSSRMIFEIFLASSWAMPSLIVAGEPELLARRLGLAGVERLQRDAALDQLLLEDVEHRLRALLAVRLDLDAVLTRPRDRGADVLEVVALRDLLGGLVEGVVDLLPVDLADDVEGRVGHQYLLGYPVIRRPAGRYSKHRHGRLPEWPKGAVCKTAGSAYDGSNPSPATVSGRRSDRSGRRPGAYR